MKKEKILEEKQDVSGKEKGKKKGFDRCSDGQKSLVRELKLVYSTRATGKYQKQKR